LEDTEVPAESDLVLSPLLETELFSVTLGSIRAVVVGEVYSIV
jgi:hypothetical protein